MNNSELLYNIENSAAWITINREKERNSLGPETVTLFLRYLDECESDPGVRALVITGAGEKAFSSGAHLGNALNEEGMKAFRDYAAFLKRLSSFPKPTVAMVNGYCLAGATGLVLASDIAVASDTAKFGTPEINVGLWPMMIGALIYRNVPRKRGMKMILTGEKFSAAEAVEMGIISEAVHPSMLRSRVNEITGLLVKKSPAGIKLGKEAFYRMQDMGFEDAVDYLCGKFSELASTEDAAVGIRAFLEKRDPVFRGK